MPTAVHAARARAARDGGPAPVRAGPALAWVPCCPRWQKPWDPPHAEWVCCCAESAGSRWVWLACPNFGLPTLADAGPGLQLALSARRHARCRCLAGGCTRQQAGLGGGLEGEPFCVAWGSGVRRMRCFDRQAEGLGGGWRAHGARWRAPARAAAHVPRMLHHARRRGTRPQRTLHQHAVRCRLGRPRPGCTSEMLIEGPSVSGGLRPVQGRGCLFPFPHLGCRERSSLLLRARERSDCLGVRGIFCLYFASWVRFSEGRAGPECMKPSCSPCRLAACPGWTRILALLQGLLARIVRNKLGHCGDCGLHVKWQTFRGSITNA